MGGSNGAAGADTRKVDGAPPASFTAGGGTGGSKSVAASSLVSSVCPSRPPSRWSMRRCAASAKASRARQASGRTALAGSRKALPPTAARSSSGSVESALSTKAPATSASAPASARCTKPPSSARGASAALPAPTHRLTASAAADTASNLAAACLNSSTPPRGSRTTEPPCTSSTSSSGRLCRKGAKLPTLGSKTSAHIVAVARHCSGGAASRARLASSAVYSHLATGASASLTSAAVDGRPVGGAMGLPVGSRSASASAWAPTKATKEPCSSRNSAKVR